MPTMRDVAKQAGVSAMTVSRVMNDPSRVHPTTRERVLEAMAVLHYVPNKGVRSNAGDALRTIALVVADFTNPFFSHIARGVESVARRFGYSVTLYNTSEDADHEWEILVSIRESRVGGVIWVPCGDVSNVSARILIEAQIPTVVVDRIIPGVPSFDAVISDNRTGAKVITSKVLSEGRPFLAVIMGSSVTSVTRDRLLGVQDALAEQDLPWDEAMVAYCDAIEPPDALWNEVRERVPGVATVFAWNQIAAAAVWRGAVQAGVKVPEQLRIATFDNPDPYGITPGFFVVAQQDPFRMGTESARELLKRLESPQSLSVTTHIVPVTIQVGSQALNPSIMDGGRSKNSGRIQDIDTIETPS